MVGSARRIHSNAAIPSAVRSQVRAADACVRGRRNPGLRSVDVVAEALRLTSLGTTELTRSAGWVTMADPEGNKFDILAAEGIDIATWAEELPPSAAARGQSRSSVRASS